MERGEVTAQQEYANLFDKIDQARTIAKEESDHENALLGMLNEERLHYIGSVVLGLNDALVELTGALAGLTLALQDTRLIVLTGSITGIAAALSMSDIGIPFNQGGSRRPAAAEGSFLYRDDLCCDGRPSDLSLSFPVQLLPGAGIHALDSRPYHRIFQLLHIGGNGSAIQEALCRNDYPESRCLRLELSARSRAAYPPGCECLAGRLLGATEDQAEPNNMPGRGKPAGA